MKIAIIAPSAVPFTIGGAEKFWWGLQQGINRYTRHQAELIKIPSPERNLLELLDSYQRFSELDLNHFDLLISTKYPAWMVNHPNHYCYLQHRLRGLYDTYHLTGLPETIDAEALAPWPPLQALLPLLQQPDPQAHHLQQFWQHWAELKPLLQSGQIPPDALPFPGPLSRAIIHFLDRCALNPRRIRAFSAISRNVAQRKNYFPAGVAVTINHHPSDLPEYRDQPRQPPPRDYIFTISRLDPPKRIAWLIKAFKKLRADVDFHIAGTGPEYEPLKRLAGDDPRIRFLGRITDAQLIEQYAGARFVPFIPYDEDYGLITIEAMRSKKPVLTTTDAGGVNEFVVHEQTGLSVEPGVNALSRAMQKLLEQPHWCQTLGQNAAHKVAHIHWQGTVQTLLQPPASTASKQTAPDQPAQARPSEGQKNHHRRIVVLLTFPVWPPRGGGQSRVYHLYKALARHHQVTLVSLVSDHQLHSGPEPAGRWQKRLAQARAKWAALQRRLGLGRASRTIRQTLQIADGLQEIRLLRSARHRQYEQQLHNTLGVPVEDIACIQGYRYNPHLLRQLQSLAASADLFIASHPYLIHAIREVWQGELWYEAHNVEYDMKQAVIGQHPEAEVWLQQTRQAEQAACAHSSTILTCSTDDARRLADLYRQPAEKMRLVPNGVALPDPPPQRLTPEQHATRPFICLFMGSWHGPNIDALEQISHIARQCPTVHFWIMGSVCQHPQARHCPGNVHLLGLVTETEKSLFLQHADLAINPMRSGSGTNLKIMDYCAHGLPVLSTPFGLRGLDYVPDQEVLSRELAQFAPTLNQLVGQYHKSHIRQQLTDMAQAAWQRTREQYDWQVIAQAVHKQLLLTPSPSGSTR